MKSTKSIATVCILTEGHLVRCEQRVAKAKRIATFEAAWALPKGWVKAVDQARKAKV